MKEDDFDRLQQELTKQMEDINLTPNADLDNLSPTDMFNILHLTFNEDSPIGFRDSIDAPVLEQIPFLNLTLEYFRILKDQGGVKLTTRGNLPTKLCFALYEAGIIKEDHIENGIVKLTREGDLVAVQNMKMISSLAGLTKKRKNEISLTSKGNKLLPIESRKELLEILFQTNYQKFNLGFHDGYPQNVGIQETFGYTLYLLLQYGDKKRPLEFYTGKCLTAFLTVLDQFEDGWRSPEKQFKSCYAIRVLERFLRYYNFVGYQNKRSPLSNREPVDVMTTEVFQKVFELKVDKFRFKKSELLA